MNLCVQLKLKFKFKSKHTRTHMSSIRLDQCALFRVTIYCYISLFVWNSISCFFRFRKDNLLIFFIIFQMFYKENTRAHTNVCEKKLYYDSFHKIIQLANFHISHIYCKHSKYTNSFHEQYISEINSLVPKKTIFHQSGA